MRRRRFVAALGTGTAVVIAGCADNGADGGTDDETAPETADSETQATIRHRAYNERTVERALETGLDARDSVVAMSERPPAIEGTGWYFGSGERLLTAGHLFAAAEDWVAWQADGTSLDPTYVDDAYISGVDVGLLRADTSGPPLSIGGTDSLEIGQPLIEVGNPGGVGNWVISLGRYLGETGGEADGFLSSIPSRGGSSGSPTMTIDGTVVGLHSGVATARDTPRDETDTAGSVYGPQDLTPKNEHVGAEAIHDSVREWTDA